MSKGVAVQTIILVILGLVVVVFISYWLYSTLTGSSPLSIEQCRTKLVSWCRMCSSPGINWAVGTLLSADADAQRCAVDYWQQLGIPQPAGAPNCNSMRTTCGNLGIR